jgi:two-component system LytT family sensor kinase
MKNKTRLVSNIEEFLKRLIIVNLIGFGIGFLIGGNVIISYWKIYVLYSGLIGLSLWYGNEALACFIDKKYSWFEFPVRKLILRILSSLIYSTFVMVVLYMCIWFFMLHKTNLTNFYEYNKWSFLIFYACTVIIMLFIHSISFFKSWQIAAVNEERLKKESVILQLQALRNQVHPHFLFNSFNTLTSLIEKDKNLAITFVKELSDMFRYMLEKDSNETVNIPEEVKFLESYIYLQKMRFGDNLKISINIRDNNHNLVPLSLQMLVENALKHNEVSDEKPFWINIFEDSDYVIVQNPIQPKLLEVPSKGIGLQYLLSRYKFLSAKEMLVLSNESEFIVKLPKLFIPD